MSGKNALSGLQGVSRFGRGRTWLATIAASIVTAYALEIVATGAGLLVVASGLLGSISHWEALALLLATYLVWGAGLWAMMLANWELLRRTGASANILSKIAHDLVARWTWNARWRRIAAHVGFMATELAKEAPYYLGAAGAALFTASITAVDAIVFLVGANMGAAAYGFTLARSIRWLAHRVGREEGEQSPDGSSLPRPHGKGASVPPLDTDRRG
ncbi:hypothetical protein [Dongia deserti]|uniref:hypothetical protein n=1 Tax=Dongia deserti TaxID=2268030 RepID=UPI0013C42935|nr:hypothetical protein [Dongia deserti]